MPQRTQFQIFCGPDNGTHLFSILDNIVEGLVPVTYSFAELLTPFSNYLLLFDTPFLKNLRKERQNRTHVYAHLFIFYMHIVSNNMHIFPK